jgi:hypothetical protein
MKTALKSLVISVILAFILPLPAWAEFVMVNNVLEPGTMLLLGSCLVALASPL